MSEELATVQDSSALTINDLTASRGGMISTVDTSSVEGKVATINALNVAESLADYPDTPLDVVDIILKPGVHRAQDGRMDDTPCVNTYLITKDGKAYFSQSDGIARSAATIIDPSMFPDCGKSTDKGCITVVVQSIDLGKGKQLKTLALV